MNPASKFNEACALFKTELYVVSAKGNSLEPEEGTTDKVLRINNASSESLLAMTPWGRFALVPLRTPKLMITPCWPTLTALSGNTMSLAMRFNISDGLKPRLC